MQAKKKKQQPRRRSPKNSKASSTAIVVPAQTGQQHVTHWRERRLSQDKVDLLKRTVAKGTDNDQFELFMMVCQKHGLDPFTKQIYCVMFPVSKHHQDDKGIWLPGHEMVIITGIGGYRMMAARDHKDYAGSSEAKFSWFDPPRQTPAKRDIPRSATVQVFRRGTEPTTTATVYWEEFAPADLSASRSDFWNRMPKNQLEKCAEAKGLRKAFPGLGDIFTDVELSQRLQDLTPEGRQIVTQDGTAPSGRAVTWDAQQRGRLDENAPHGHLAGTDKARQAEEQLRKVEEADKALLEARNVTPKASIPKDEPKAAATPVSASGRPILEAEAVDPDHFIIRGDVQETFAMVEHYCKFTDGWWRSNLANLQAMQSLQDKLRFQINAIPSQSSPAKGAGRKQTTPAGGRSSQIGAAGPATGPELVTGIITKVQMGMTSKNSPTRQVRITKTWHCCYSQSLFQFLDKGESKAVEAWVKGPKKDIVGLKRLGAIDFDEDGKTPIIRREDQEVGGKTLFGV